MADIYIDLSLVTPGGDGSINTPYGRAEWPAHVTEWTQNSGAVLHIEGDYEYHRAVLEFINASITPGTDSIQARITANLKTALSGITGIVSVDEMRSALDLGAFPFIMLQEIPVEYNEDYQHANDVTYQYNALYFGGDDEKPKAAFTNQNKNVAADIIRAIEADRTRGQLAQNTIITGSGPGFYTDDGGVLPITFVAIDVQALVNADNPYQLG